MNLKRILALALAVVITAGSFGALAVTAGAETVETTDSYVLNFSPDNLSGYAYNKPYWFTTPFTVNHRITYEDGTEYYDGGNFPEVFNLINTTKLAAGGEGAYASILAYCTDASTGTVGNTSYRRINLEDSAYYESGAAGRIRSVFMNGFPSVDAEQLQANANIWLKGQGMPEIQGLQSGEAILATQVTIWKLANGENYTINSFFDGMQDMTESWLGDYLDQIIDTSTVSQQETEHTAQNIESLFNYLYNLQPMGPQRDAVSEFSFERVVYHAVKAADGTYTVTVDFTVNTQIGSGDTLTLSATCGEQVVNQSLTQAGAYSVTFEELTERIPVKLEINGYQLGGDVYLFDAEGDRRASQSMVGYDDSLLPVHGEIEVTPDRVLNIYKTTSEENGKIPLANIEFEIYFVANMAQIESADPETRVELSEKPTAEEIAAYQTPENWIATVKTDVQGFATFNFTKAGQPDGVYLVVERDNAATTGPVEPFFVIIPGTTENEDGFAYTVNVNPKNVTEVGPDISKDVTKLDNNSDSYDVDEEHIWIIRGGVPAGIADAEKYEITDVIDYRLTYTKGSPVVKLFNRAGEELELTAGTHYTLSEGTVEKEFDEVGIKTVDRFAVALTKEGMAFVAANLGAGEANPEIRVYFKAAINSNAEVGEEIPNQAHLDYTNSAGVDYESDSDIPEVHTGGLNILKTDKDDVPLAGAVFRIAREATEEELLDETVEKQVLNVEGNALNVVFEDFYTTSDLSGEKADAVTTGEDGEAVIYGLAYGTYYIVETKAPDGYNLLTAPIRVEISATSHLKEADGVLDVDGQVIDSVVTVINTRFVLPETGGMGTTLFTVVGLGVIAMASVLLLCGGRKKKV